MLMNDPEEEVEGPALMARGSSNDMIIELPSSDPSISLEGVLNITPNSNIIAVLIHPYPPLGGNYNNPVIRSMAAILMRLGMSTLRINLRGVGQSKGSTSWTGHQESEDIVAASIFIQQYLMEEFGWEGGENELEEDGEKVKVLLLGYSYGAVISSRAAASPRLEKLLAGLIAINYPSQVLWALTALNQDSYLNQLSQLPLELPKLFLLGDKDNFSSQANWREMTKRLNEPKDLFILEETDHFFSTEVSFRQLAQLIHMWASSLSTAGKLD